MLAPMQTTGQIRQAPETPQGHRTDPGVVMRTRVNFGSAMEEHQRNLICHGCGCFLSCSDHL
jgi:hypothetical protein